MILYKNMTKTTGGHITDNKHINLDRVQLILSELSKCEKETFKKRHLEEVSVKFRGKDKTKFKEKPESRVDNKDKSEVEFEDKVRLHEEGYRDRYYEIKFQVHKEDFEFRRKLVTSYIEGLCWVFGYYKEDVPSWDWCYAYHYAPLVSDFTDISSIKIEFKKGTPLSPLSHLMAILPARSKHFLPEPFGKLMCHPDSPIGHFYPSHFQIDMNRKKHSWQAVVLIPFVDKELLIKTLAPIYCLLTPAELQRNEKGKDVLFINTVNRIYDFIITFFEDEPSTKKEFKIDGKLYNGIVGTLFLTEDTVYPKKRTTSPICGHEDLLDNQVICLSFKDEDPSLSSPSKINYDIKSLTDQVSTEVASPDAVPTLFSPTVPAKENSRVVLTIVVTSVKRSREKSPCADEKKIKLDSIIIPEVSSAASPTDDIGESDDKKEEKDKNKTV